MNKKRISILVATVISAFILTGAYVSNVNALKASVSFETLKGSLDSLGDTKLVLRGYGGLLPSKDINLSKDGETSNISSLNSNINYDRAFSKEFINENKDFFKVFPYTQVIESGDYLVSADFGSDWINNERRTYLNVKIKKAKEKTESFKINIDKFNGNNIYGNRIIDIAIDGDNILALGNIDTDKGNKGILLKININDKSCEVISDNIFRDVDEDIYLDKIYELMLTKKNVYFQTIDAKGSSILVKKDFAPDKKLEIIYKNKTEIIHNTVNYDLDKKQMYNIVVTADNKLNLIVVDGNTEEVKVYEDLKSEKFKVTKQVPGKEYTSESIDKILISGNNLIMSYAIPAGVDETGRISSNNFLEVIDLNTKQSVYLGKYSNRTSIFEYTN